jgi:hypothetical protein
MLRLSRQRPERGERRLRRSVKRQPAPWFVNLFRNGAQGRDRTIRLRPTGYAGTSFSRGESFGYEDQPVVALRVMPGTLRLWKHGCAMRS